METDSSLIKKIEKIKSTAILLKDLDLVQLIDCFSFAALRCIYLYILVVVRVDVSDAS